MARRESHGDVGFNMAPMIDVVFLLIIFFTLVSTFASAENVPMDLPQPDRSLAKNVKLSDRVVINCRAGAVAADGEPTVLYSVGPNPAEPLERISDRLAAARAAVPELRVIIRADKRLRFDKVRAAMEAVAENGIENMSLVALVGTNEE